MPSPQVYKWKTPTKIIAITDLVLSIATIILLAIALIFLLIGTSLAMGQLKDEERFGNQQEPQQFAGVFFIVAAILFGIAILLLVINIVAAARLLGSTKEGITPSEAISKAKCWRIMNIIFVVLCVLGIFGGGDASQKGTSLFNGIIRGMGVVIVTLFMKELDAAAITPQVYYEAGQA